MTDIFIKGRNMVQARETLQLIWIQYLASNIEYFQKCFLSSELIRILLPKRARMCVDEDVGKREPL